MSQDERQRLDELYERSERARAETITVEEAAHYLDRTPATVYRWIAEGRLPGIRDRGRRLLVPLMAVTAELDRIIKQLEGGTEEAAG